MPDPWLLLIPVALLAFAFFSRWILDNPREDVDSGIMWHICRHYGRRMHRLRYIGLENLPTARPSGPLIIVSNHASGVDPVLLVGACRFPTRWIMAKDMRYPFAEPFWKFADVIMVDRKKRDASGTREAMNYITGGGAVGIFPEGGIERPAETLRPFQPGVGLFIRRTGAPVLPVIIRGMPYSDTVSKSFWMRGRATMEFKPLIRYTGKESAEEIAADLQRRYQEWTGWPVRAHEVDSSTNG